jgi:hypothetical protein
MYGHTTDWNVANWLTRTQIAFFNVEVIEISPRVILAGKRSHSRERVFVYIDQSNN